VRPVLQPQARCGALRVPAGAGRPSGAELGLAAAGTREGALGRGLRARGGAQGRMARFRGPARPGAGRGLGGRSPARRVGRGWGGSGPGRDAAVPARPAGAPRPPRLCCARLGGRGRGRGRGAAAPRAAAEARGPRRAMATGSITTLPARPEDGGGTFPPGHFKDPKRLYCKNGGFFLRIRPDGRVDGVREKSDPHVKLQLQAEERGVVSIKGVCADRYLAMKEDGRLQASKCVTDECFFFERLEPNNYNTYRSRKYSGWYVALKRTGQYKLGPKTGPGQKAVLFLPMSARSSS
ncbi:Fibroblast growth factor 2, partial [Galemys pyrenaicus]